MKNVKLNLAKSVKAGFSLVEMLVVIAIIGIIAAIAIPNIGNLNQSATNATAQRNAQSLASVFNAAQTADAELAPAGKAAAAAALTGAGTTIANADSAFNHRTFTAGTMAAADVTRALEYLTLTDGMLVYSKTP